VACNTERGERFLDQGQLRGRAVVGLVATEQAKLSARRARFHLTHDLIEPGTAGWFESVQIVYRDKCEIISRRRVFAAESTGPKPEGKHCAGAGRKAEPLAASEAVAT
jgi:hypothetical protein